MNKIKSNRTISFIVILIAYILATIAGVVTYKSLNLSLEWNLFIADSIATVVIFVFSIVFKNSSIYDPYWSVQPMVILAFFACKFSFNLTKVLILSLIMLWGIRLTLNWAYTFKNLNHQDWRYVNIKNACPKIYPILNFVGIHYIPTVIVYLCTLPAVYVLGLKNPKINIITVVGLFISIIGIVLELVSDIQMQKYRKEKGTKFIRVGLWKYSRHPNYLGEILMWWGIAIFAASTITNNWYIQLIGAFINTLLFLFVSIPMAERRQSKKEGFEEYKKQTRYLLPIKK